MSNELKTVQEVMGGEMGLKDFKRMFKNSMLKTIAESEFDEKKSKSFLLKSIDLYANDMEITASKVGEPDYSITQALKRIFGSDVMQVISEAYKDALEEYEKQIA